MWCNDHPFSLVMHRALLHVHPRVRASILRLTKQSSSSAAAEPFLSGSSGSYVEQMYEAWSQDPSSVHKVGSTNSSFVVYIRVHVYMYIHSPM